MGALFSKWCEDIKIKITIKSFFESILDVFTECLSILDFLKHQFFKLLIIHSFSPAPPREGLFCALSGVTADTFMVLAVFFKLIDSIWQHLA